MTGKSEKNNGEAFHPDDMDQGYNKSVAVYDKGAEATPRNKFVSAISKALKGQVYPDMIRAMGHVLPAETAELLGDGVPTPLVGDIRVAEIDSDSYSNVHLVKLMIEIPFDKEDNDLEGLQDHVDKAVAGKMILAIV